MRHVRWSSDDQTSGSGGMGGVADGPHHQLVAESDIHQPAPATADMADMGKQSLIQGPAVAEPRSPSSIAARQFNVAPTDQFNELAQSSQLQLQPPDLSLKPSLPGPPEVGLQPAPAPGATLPALQGPASQQAPHMVWNSGTAALQKAPHSAAAPAQPKVPLFPQTGAGRLSLLLGVFLLIIITIRLALQPRAAATNASMKPWPIRIAD